MVIRRGIAEHNGPKLLTHMRMGETPAIVTWGLPLALIVCQNDRYMIHGDRRVRFTSLPGRARRQDPDAGVCWSRSSIRWSFASCVRHLPSRAAEEDLAQDIFAKIFSRLDQYQPRHAIPFEHWVSRLAVRTCLDGLRAERRRPNGGGAICPRSRPPG